MVKLLICGHAGWAGLKRVISTKATSEQAKPELERTHAPSAKSLQGARCALLGKEGPVEAKHSPLESDLRGLSPREGGHAGDPGVKMSWEVMNAPTGLSEQ